MCTLHDNLESLAAATAHSRCELSDALSPIRFQRDVTARGKVSHVVAGVNRFTLQSTRT